MNIIGRVLQLIRAVRAGSLIKHIEQAVERGLCAGIRVAANRTQCAVDRVEQLVGRGERFGSGVDQLGALVDGGRGDRGQLVERLGQCRNLGQLLVDAAKRGIGEFGQLFALGGEVLTETLVIVEYIADIVEIVEDGIRGVEEAGQRAGGTRQVAGCALQRVQQILGAAGDCAEQLTHACSHILSNHTFFDQGRQYVRHCGIDRTVQIIQSLDTVVQIIHIALNVLQILLHIGKITLQLTDIQPLRTGLIIQIIHEILEIIQRGTDILQQRLVLGDIRTGLLERIENAVRSRVQLNERVLGVIQFRDQRIAFAGQLFQSGQRGIRFGINRAAVLDQLLAHGVNARNTA